MKIAVIDNYDSFVFNLVRYVEEEGKCEVYMMKNDHIDYEILDKCQAILLSPGPGIPSEAGELMSVIERYHDTKKILGVCLGHQAIVEYFGGTLKQMVRPLHGKASEIYHTNTSSLFENIPKTFHAGRYHSWSADKLPPSLQVTAVSFDQEIMAIQHKSLQITGIQFHPESILTPDGRKMIRNWLEC